MCDQLQSIAASIEPAFRRNFRAFVTKQHTFLVNVLQHTSDMVVKLVYLCLCMIQQHVPMSNTSQHDLGRKPHLQHC